MDVRELAWASGLFDGEGCISMGKVGRAPNLLYAKVDLAMTDRDAVERFQRAVGGVGTVVTRPINRSGTFEHRLPLFVWKAHSFEHAQAVVGLLWYGLNARRRARAIEVLNAVRASQVHRKTMRRGDACVFTDCDRPVQAQGRCARHYQWRYKEARRLPCLVESCSRHANGSRGLCRPHAEASAVRMEDIA